jgi:hypothetical protein
MTTIGPGVDTLVPISVGAFRPWPRFGVVSDALFSFLGRSRE